MSIEDNIAIQVENVSKTFKLPHEKNNSIKGLFVNMFRGKRTFERQQVLKNISFEIRKGEFFGIVGRNGSGKSTLLKLLAGIYVPDKGHVRVNGKLTPFIELGVGFNPELTGRENVFLNGALLGFNRKEMEGMYDKIVEFAELGKFMDQKLKNYSSGMQVRLAFSIAIRANTDILVLDEVLAVGDAAFQRKCFEFFRDIKESGHHTVILVTHDMNAVQEFCDRAMMVQDSRVVDINEPHKIALRYELANISNNTGGGSGAELQRPKNAAIKIMDVSLYKNGKRASNFSIKDDIQVGVQIKSIHPTPVQLNMFLSNQSGEYLVGINSTLELGRDYRPVKGEHTLTCTINAGQLAKGIYSVGVGVYTSGYVPELIDVIDMNYDSSAPKLTIVDQSPNKNGEFFYLGGDWSKSS